MQKVRVIILLLIILIHPVIKADGKDSIKSSHQAFGAELSFSQQLSVAQSPYGFPVGMGIFYQFTGSSSLPILIGLDVNAYGFPPRDSTFGSSFMVIPSLSLGFGFQFPLYENASLELFPIIKYGQYFRTFIYNGEKSFGTRPAISAGMEFFLYSEKNIMFSLGIYYTILLDNNPVHLISYKNRSGFVF
jgi:hypothetical protein